MPGRSETNGLYLTGRLREIGVTVTSRVTVADDLELLASAFRGALSRADVVIATGGLGPPQDDPPPGGAGPPPSGGGRRGTPPRSGSSRPPHRAQPAKA